MALIGTISGSVGAGNALVSSTAVSGTLIIADSPPSSFPTLQSGVKLFVSGNKTALGADTPNAIFGGDTFVSGAFGTDSYIQMKPVNTLRIPTNTSASYIYTSGSTNDLYYTQYQPGTSYTNTIRMRWLEGSLITGLLSGGVLSTTNGTTTFNITAGSGIIVDYNASTTTDPYPTVREVRWAAQTGIPLTYAASAQITYVAIDSSGVVTQRNTPYIDGDFNNYIVIGRILHQVGGVTNGTSTSPTTTYGSVQAATEFMRVFGPLKISGHALSVNATATNPPTNTEYLGLAKTAGDSFVEGRNYTTDPNDPWYISSTSDTALTTSKIFRQYLDASGNPVIETNSGTGYVAIDPTKRYVAGSVNTVTSNKFTIQRVYWFPNSVNRALYVYYGVDEYQSIAEAEAAISSEAFTEGANTIAAAILVGYIIVRGSTTNLGTASDAKIVQAGTFRGIVQGGGGSAGTTLPAGSDTYVQFNDGGTAFGGDAGLTYIKGTDTLNVVNVGMTATNDQTWSLKDNSAGALNISAGTGNNRWTFKTGDNDEKLVFWDSVEAAFGDLNTPDMKIKHDGTNSSIKNETGQLIISGANGLYLTGTLNVLNDSIFARNITGSNALLTGDLAVNGGDITSTVALNISAGSSGLAFQRSGTSFLTFTSSSIGSGPGLINLVTLQASSDKNLIIAGGLGRQVVASGSSIELRASTTGINFSTEPGGLAENYLNFTSGTYATVGSTALNVAKMVPGDLPQPHDLLVGASSARSLYLSGTSIVANTGNTGYFFQRDGSSYGVIQGISGSSFTIGSAAGVISMNLVSSGNVTVVLDADNNNTGHKFAIQDWRNIEQFSVGENGNAELSGSLIVSGSSIQTITPTTFNLLTTTLTGTLNIGTTATIIGLGSTISTGSFNGDFGVSGRSGLGGITERLTNTNGGTGTVNFDLIKQSIFYVNGPTGNITANFVSVPTTEFRVLTPTVILSQSVGASRPIVSSVTIDGGAAQTINWSNGVTPTGNSGKQDVFGFSLIRSGSAWKVLGQMSTYG